MESPDVSRAGLPGQEPVAHRPLRSYSRRELFQQALELPNLVTLLRISSVPVLVWAVLVGHPVLSFGLFVVASLSDGLDGLLARLLDKRTPLGAFIDPIADKLLTLAALVALTVRGALPVWLLGLVLFRDGGILVAAVVLRASGRGVPAAPTRLGKYATFFLLLAITLAFAHEIDPRAHLKAPIAVSGVLAAQCVVGAVIQYFLRWRRLMYLPPPFSRNDGPKPPRPRAPNVAPGARVPGTGRGTTQPTERR